MDLRRMLGGVALLAATCLLAAPASAQVSRMKRGAENIVMVPVDVALTPVVVANTLRSRLDEANMPTALAVPTAGAGVILYSTLQLVVTGARLFAGLVELPVGALLTPLDAIMDADLSGGPVLFSTEGNEAILRHETSALDFVSGVYYLRGY